MTCFVRTFLVVCTALAAFVASSLQGKVLCFGEEGHAAVEPPHAKAPCAATHESHEHDGDGREDDDRECSDVSADFLTLRDGAAAAGDVSHFDLILLSPPLRDTLISTLNLPRPRFGLGTHPPSNGDLACLRCVILLA
jgi:hypothetical protein